MRNHLLRAAAGAGAAGPANPYDIEYATFEGADRNFQSLPVGGNNTGLFFKPDGTSFYTTGSSVSSDQVIEWDVTTAWDITSASFSQGFSVASQETTPEGVHFKSDGTKMYVVGRSSDTVYEYDLSTAWDISTASYQQGFSVSTQEGSPYDIAFSSDGSELYITGYDTDGVVQYTLSTAWDVSTASYTATFSASAQGTDFQGLHFKPDGTKFYLIRRNAQRVYEYALSTAWDISTASFTHYGSLDLFSSIQSALFIKPDGTKLYFIDYNRDHILQCDISTAWDASTVSFTAPTTDYYEASIPPQGQGMRGICFGDSGSAMYTLDNNVDALIEYSLSSPYAIETASYVQTLSVSAQEANPGQPRFSPDGTEFYLVGYTSDNVVQYSLSTAWDISTASYTQSFSVSTQDSTPSGLWFKPDGTVMFVLGMGNDAVYKYDLSTAWDISTASYSGDSFSIGVNVSWRSLAFNPQGTIMHVNAESGGRFYQYRLSTAWDITTAVYDVSLYIYYPYTVFPAGIDFNDDGSKLFVTGAGARPRIWAFTIP